ncbi:MAG: efflux RND transporter permease subunit [Planctomycetota bacterium]
MASLTVRRPVATTMAALGVFLFGLLSLRGVPLDLLPDLSYPAITIEVPFAGASPQEVETLIVRPVEDAVSVTQGLARLRSVCIGGQGRVSLLFRWGTRMDVAALEVREKLQQVELPEGAETPRVLRFDPGQEPILRVALTPRQARGEEGLISLRRLAEERVKPALERLEGVAAARVQGGLEEEVLVFVDPRAAELAGVTLDEVSTRLAAESVNLAGGTLTEGKLEYRVRTLNELRELSELREVVIAQREQSGQRSTVRLGQLAEVRRGSAERQVITRLDGAEAIEVAVFKASGQNTVAVAEAARARLEELSRKGGLLTDVRWVVTSDQSAFIRSSLDDLTSTAWTGGVLAVLVLLLFLRDLRATLTIAFAIPLSLVATFLLMRGFGVTLNVMSLSGIALAIGMLVDNAIVVLESIAAERARVEEELRSGEGVGLRSEGGGAEAGTGTGTGTDSQALAPQAEGPGAAAAVLLSAEAQRRRGAEGPSQEQARDSEAPDSQTTATEAGGTGAAQALLLSAEIAESAEIARSERGGDSAAQSDRDERTGTGTEIPMSDSDSPSDSKSRPRPHPPISADSAISALSNNAVANPRDPGLATRPGSESPVSASVSGSDSDSDSASDSTPAPTPASDADSVVRGTELVSAAVIASTLTTLSVFLPVAFVEGVASRLFADQAYTIVFALAASLVASLSVIPMLAATRVLETPLRWLGYLVELLLTPLRWLHALAWGAVDRAYPRVLGGALRRPVLVLALATIATGVALERVTRLGADFLPDMHPGLVNLELSLPRGASLDQTDGTLERVAAAAREVEGVEAAFATAGAISRPGEPDELRESVGQLLVRLKPGAGAEGEARAIAALRARVGEEPGLLAPVFRKAGLVSVRTPLEVLVEGRDLVALEKAAERVVARLSQVPGLTDLRSSARGGRPEVRIGLDRRKLAQYELDAARVSAALELAVRGKVSTDLVRSDRELPIRVMLAPDARATVRDLERVIVSPAGAPPITLRSVGEVVVERGPAEIRREGQRRVAVVSAEVQGRDLAGAAEDARAALRDLELPPGTFAHLGGSAEELGDAFRGLAFAIGMAILLVYLVLAAQFESFLHPLIILGAVPLAGAGAALGLWLTHTPVSVVVLIGVVVLAGIVVNNAILLVDRVNQLRREEGWALDLALLQAGRDRLRPIVMTTATTVLGLLPLVLVPGDGAELRAPLAITLISGLTSSTLLTLVAVPCAYRLLEARRASA